MAINKKTKTNKTQSTKNAEQITEVNKIPFDHFVSEYYPKLFEAEYPLSYSDLQSNNLTGKGVSSLLDRINKALSVATSQNPSPYIRALNLAKSGELPNPDEVQELNESSLLPVVLSLKTNPAELNRKILKDLEDLPQRAKNVSNLVRKQELKIKANSGKEIVIPSIEDRKQIEENPDKEDIMNWEKVFMKSLFEKAFQGSDPKKGAPVPTMGGLVFPWLRKASFQKKKFKPLFFCRRKAKIHRL